MISKADVRAVLEQALAGGADFAELFIEDRDELSILYHSAVSDLSQGHIYGAGLYIMSGTDSVYVYTNDTSAPALAAMCRQATGALHGSGHAGGAAPFVVVDRPDPNPVKTIPSSVALSKKIRLLTEADQAARGMGSDVINVELGYYDTDQRVLIANSEGVWAEDRRVTSRLRVFPVLEKDGCTEGYFTDFTRPSGFEAFADGRYLLTVKNAVSEIRASLCADEAPNGTFPVVLAGGSCSGTFFHEACGHQLETNGTLLNEGIFLHKLGQKIASDKVTLVDDGTMPHAYGSSKFDDEGMPRRKNVLIENGVLKNYLTDRLGSRRLGIERNACGRRQGYAFAPCARMSNTYLAPGTDDPDEMIRSLPEGLFVTRMGGGQGGREFTILAQTAYLIKNGAIDRQVKGAMLMGRGDETMLKIDRVGNVLELEESGLFCGGGSGLCNTTTSGARMRVTEMHVAGKGGRS